MKNTLTILTIIAALLTASAACVGGSQSIPMPTPIPPTAEERYKYFKSVNDANPSTLREMEHEDWFKFQGQIAWIDDRQIRFYIEPPEYLTKEKYVECNFKSDADLARVANLGDHVTVRGRLVRAFRGRSPLGVFETEAVVFEDCRILLVHRQ